MKCFPTCLAFLLTVPVVAQEAELAAAVKKMMAQFQEAGVALDREAKTITLQGAVCRPDQPLEYLLIHARGKAHEALVQVDVKASLLNAALLVLGYEKGENANFLEIDPEPTIEEIRAGAPIYEVIHPKGMEVWFSLKFVEPEGEHAGKKRHLAIEDVLIDRITGNSVQDNRWIYLGGQMGSINRGDPEVFLADYTNNLVSTCYLKPGNHLVTIAHERANDEQNWWIHKQMPPAGTEVEFIIHATKPQVVIERERRLAEESEKNAESPKEDGRGGD